MHREKVKKDAHSDVFNIRDLFIYFFNFFYTCLILNIDFLINNVFSSELTGH